MEGFTMSDKHRLVVQIGRNAPSLGWSLAAFSDIASDELQVMFVGDQQCQEDLHFKRVQAWLGNNWSTMYELNPDERSVFTPPRCQHSVDYEINTIPPLNELDPGHSFKLNPLDIIDVRPGTKQVSQMLVYEAVTLFGSRARLAYSDPHSREVINIQNGEILVELSSDRFTLCEYLWLIHNGPVVFDDPPSINLDEEVFAELNAQIPDPDQREWRNRLHQSLCAMLEEDHVNRAIILERATAAVCSDVLEGEWGLNVKFFDPSLEERKFRLRSTQWNRWLMQEEKRCEQEEQPLPTEEEMKAEWKESLEPYDPKSLVEEAFRHEIDVIGYVQDRLFLISCKDHPNPDGIWAEIGNVHLRLRKQFKAVNGHAIIVTGVPMGEEYQAYADRLEVHTCSILELPRLLRSLV